MAICVPQGARGLMLARIMDNLVGDLVVQLYQSDISVSPDRQLSDFAIADFPGYADVPLTGRNVTFDATAGKYVTTWDDANFARTGSDNPQSIYGYVVMSTAYGLYWFERFATPVTFNDDGDAFTLHPRFSLWSYPTV